jgi:hypothetical protein
MFREVRSTYSKLFLVVTAVFRVLVTSAILTGCTTAAMKLERRETRGGARSRVFHAKYSDVEQALKVTMIKYPQKIDNSDAGLFETDFVKGDARFIPAHKEVKLDNGNRYRLIVRLVRGKIDKSPTVKVLIIKQVEMARDFFSTPEPLMSDGYEEDVILYRIGRELAVSRAVANSVEKVNGAASSNDPPAVQ